MLQSHESQMQKFEMILERLDLAFLVPRHVGDSRELVEPGGIEPPTSCVQGRRSPS